MKNHSNLFARALATALLLGVSCIWPVAAPAAVSPVVTAKLPNGSTLVVRQDKIAPRVAISLLVRAGAADENPQNAGWRQVLAAAMLHATLIQSSEADKGQIPVLLDDWQKQAEKWGGQIGATVGDDFIEYWANGDSGHASEMLKILLQVVTSPRLAESDFVDARRRALSLQNQANTGVASRAAQSLSGQLYRDAQGTPLAYALPTFGNFESLGGMTSEQLRELHRVYFTPSRITLSAAGDVDVEALRLELAALPAAPTEETLPADKAPAFAPIIAKAPPFVVREMNTIGAWVFVAYRTPGPSALSASEYAALKVLVATLDGGSLSRLQRRLIPNAELPRAARNAREAAGQVAAQLTSRRWSNEVIVFAQTDPQNVDSVKNALLDEIAKLRTAPLSAAELLSAKRFARGQWSSAREEPGERAFEAGAAALFGVTPDSQWPVLIEAVTAASVQQVANKYLGAYSVVLIMPESP